MATTNDSMIKIENAAGKRFDIDQNAVINIFNLYKVYKRDAIEVVALRGLNLRAKKGELLMVAGPSGCGKTTLLNVLGGLDKPTSGNVFIDGEDITLLNFDDLTKFRRIKIGFVFQFMNLVKSLNAYENIELPLVSLGVHEHERKKRINELLEAVGLRDRRLHYPSELSGGEQQRIAIATALANNPSIILADEPTGELDSTNANEIMRMFKSLLQKYPDKTIIVVTHDLSLKKYADRLVRMKDGLVDESVALQYTRNTDFQGSDDEQSTIMVDTLVACLPEYPSLSEVINCSQCGDSKIQISILKSVNVEKPHPLFELRDIVVICTECQHVEKIRVKMFHP
ncbi:MAG TPA: ABC transporter ATP-binding protein [Candidatus Lokiarchaeia archaeon]|nr:ABC transporter ATP-binding protein [Candidatus Lokiarchaeia archaeon]